MFGIGKNKTEKQVEELDKTEVESERKELESKQKDLMVTDAKVETKPEETKKSQVPTILGIKEQKALKRSHYEDIAYKFNKVFIIKHKKSGMVVELRAASPVHAATLIGWRPRQVKLLSEKSVENEGVITETIQDIKEEIKKQESVAPGLK